MSFLDHCEDQLLQFTYNLYQVGSGGASWIYINGFLKLFSTWECMKVFLHLEFGIKPDVFNLECAHYILGAKTWYNINVQYFIKIIFNFYYLINIPWKVAKGARHEQTILLWMKYLIFTLLAKNCPFCHQHSTFNEISTILFITLAIWPGSLTQ